MGHLTSNPSYLQSADRELHSRTTSHEVNRAFAGETTGFKSRSATAAIVIFLIFLSSTPGEGNILSRNQDRGHHQSKWEAPCMAPRETHISNGEGSSLKRLVEDIADMALTLHQKLNILKASYARKRFGDTQEHVDLENRVLELSGHPRTHSRSNTTNDIQKILAIIRSSTEDVARMVAFWELAEAGEKYEEPGHNFESQFSAIGSDSQCGLYWLLCNMHLILEEFDITPYREATKNDLIKIQQNVAHSRAIRHSRDYLAMHYLQKTLHHVRNEMLVAKASLE